MNEFILQDVSYSYKKGGTAVLDGVSAQFVTGRTYAVVGASGSGKTTLLSIMAGLDRPSSGSLRLDGQDLAGMNLDDYRRQDSAMVYQAFQLFPLLTVIENVRLPMELNDVDKAVTQQRAEALLTRVGIDAEKYRRYPSNLSGGEQQRVAIARALASGAGLILADEPTGNLDGENSRNIVELLSSLAREEERCVIIVTHDPDVAAAADEVYRMHDGKLLPDEQ